MNLSSICIILPKTKFHILVGIAYIFAIGFSSVCKNFENIRAIEPRADIKERGTLQVMSFNIRIGMGNARETGLTPPHIGQYKFPLKLEPIVAAIQSTSPEIVGLQEVMPYQAPKLAKALNMNYAFVFHNPSGGGGGDWWGVAVLSKFKILDAQRKQISWGPGNNRSILIVTVEMGGLQATFVSVHKHFKVKDDSEVKKIAEIVGTIKGPIVLIGDFNLSPGDYRLESLKKVGIGSHDNLN